MKIILIGIQGSGKSTQGLLLSEKLHVPYLATGQIFRNIAKEETELGTYLRETMKQGLLVPDEKVLEIVQDYLSRPEYQSGYILDGFPRTLGQAQVFNEDIDAVVYLRVSDQEALNRISKRNSNREDDTVVAIQKRIELFHEFTEPVIAYYREKGILLEVDGEQTVEKIFADIVAKLPSQK